MNFIASGIRNSTMPTQEEQPSGDEVTLAGLMQGAAATQSAVSKRIELMPTGERCVMKDHWLALYRDSGLATWQRLESSRILVEKCVTFPCDLDEFTNEVLASLGVHSAEIQEVSKWQKLPIERKLGDWIRMAKLPISTRDQQVAAYFVVNRLANTVQRAEVHATP